MQFVLSPVSILTLPLINIELTFAIKLSTVATDPALCCQEWSVSTGYTLMTFEFKINVYRNLFKKCFKLQKINEIPGASFKTLWARNWENCAYFIVILRLCIYMTQLYSGKRKSVWISELFTSCLCKIDLFVTITAQMFPFIPLLFPFLAG